MHSFFYLRLALTNIRKNKRSFVPFMLTCAGTIAMYYIMHMLAGNQGLKDMAGGAYLDVILNLGVIVIAIFAAIFLFYTNSFLIKRRKKEFGLYSILGMERKHVARVLFWENLCVAVAALALGLTAGILLSRLMFLLLLRIMSFPVTLAFALPPASIANTLALFGAIYLALFLCNLWRIRLAQPIELLRGGQVGEREPKTRWILTAFGALCLGGGYAIALTTESPLEALYLFFVAVVLVILGTYALFTSGSIALLKGLRRNKGFYYKPAHFTGVSGMIYRMKQNAAGLASICILSTAVLVMISTTLSMYIGMEDVLTSQFPRDIAISTSQAPPDEEARVRAVVDAEVSARGLAVNRPLSFRFLSVSALREADGRFHPEPWSNQSDAYILYFFAADEYNRAAEAPISLREGEVLIHSEQRSYSQETIELLGMTYRVKDTLDDFPLRGIDAMTVVTKYFIVVPDQAALEALAQQYHEEYGDAASGIEYFLGFDVDAKGELVLALRQSISDALRGEDRSVYVRSTEETRDDFLAMYGGLFFLGIFLGALFIMATVMIIYYKQISEGYDDQERYRILRKVGMGQDEVRKTITSQILLVFFIPLAASALHLAAVFKIITKLLAILSLTNIALFALCAVATFAVFALFYAVIYRVTARSYYRIVY